ncbi:MAG TPA: hypothetical protein VGJ13_05010 [Pseudonocardiaceae bacterium]|jgi:hypothetical protein
MPAYDDYDDPTDVGRLSAADERAIYARRGIGPVTPAAGEGPHRARNRGAERPAEDQPSADYRPHMRAIRKRFGWPEPTPQEMAKRDRVCPTCGADRGSACTRRWGGRGPQVEAHSARSEVEIPAQR